MPTRTAVATLLAAFLTASAAPAPAKSPAPVATPGAKQCFFARSADGFAAPDDKTLYVRVSVRDVYRFDMFGACQDMDWSQQIALVSRGSSSICTGMDAEVVTRSPIGPLRCPVRNVRKLTPEEVAALPRGSRP